MFFIDYASFKPILRQIVPREGTIHAHAANALPDGASKYQTGWMFRFEEEGSGMITVQAGDVSDFSEADDLTVTSSDRILVGLFDPTPNLRHVPRFVESLADAAPHATMIVFTNRRDLYQKEHVARELLNKGYAHFCVLADHMNEAVGMHVLGNFLDTIREKRAERTAMAIRATA